MTVDTDTAKFDKLVKDIEGLSILEIAQFGKFLQERWGVSAAPVAVAAAGGAQAGGGAPVLVFQGLGANSPRSPRPGTTRANARPGAARRPRGRAAAPSSRGPRPPRRSPRAPRPLSDPSAPADRCAGR